jgi:hypothetical protein
MEEESGDEERLKEEGRAYSREKSWGGRKS